MQSILNIKNKMETQARMEYGLARLRLNEEEEKLKKLRFRKQSYEQKATKLLKDALKVREIIDSQTAIKRMKEYIEEQCIVIRIEEKKVEEARLKLLAVMQERKTHEKLREKAFETFKQEENANERKEIDQLTSYTYGKRIAEDV